jgi:signal transduction histidine kinase
VARPSWSTLSLRSRVRLVLTALAVPPVVAIAVALATEPATDAARRDVAERLAPAQLEVEQLRAAMIDQETGLRGYLLTGEDSFLAPYDSGRARSRRVVDALRAGLGSPRLLEVLDDVDEAKMAWEAQAEDARMRIDIGLDSARIRKATFDDLRVRLADLDGSVSADVRAAERRYDDRRHQQRLLLGWTIGAASVLAIVGGFALNRSLRGPLERLAAGLEAAASDPDAAMPVGGPAEVAAIASRADVMRRSALDESRERLRRGLVVAQEDERRRIAAGLHDDVIQSLTAVGLRLQAVRTVVPEDERDLVDGATDAIGDATDRLRSLLFELHPPALERHGLVAALESFGLGLFNDGRGAVDLGRPAAELRVRGDAGEASSALQAIAYRAAREALTNAWKHAGASTVDVVVVSDTEGLTVTVADDGRGFDPGADKTAGTGATRPGHLGLLAAEELVVGSEGRWTVTAAPGRGTTVEIWLPDPDRATTD